MPLLSVEYSQLLQPFRRPVFKPHRRLVRFRRNFSSIRLVRQAAVVQLPVLERELTVSLGRRQDPVDLRMFNRRCQFAVEGQYNPSASTLDPSQQAP